ncbi:MAG TPA: hypothetical protein VIE43_06690 [Thermoanaerobaculia bacterium]|jgi:hypothetical protein|nr:hypothetical protein [Thermoanaerobaculia bacterium]
MRQNPRQGDIRFYPRLQISPFALFRAFKEGRAPVLVDVRMVPGLSSFPRAIQFWDPEWDPPEELEAVLFDDDGEEATALALELQKAGFPRMRALFGGLKLYDFALDPGVVGEERFLRDYRESDSSS